MDIFPPIPMIIHTHANSKYLGWIRYWCIGCDDALDEAIKTFKTDSAHMGGKKGSHVLALHQL